MLTVAHSKTEIFICFTNALHSDVHINAIHTDTSFLFQSQTDERAKKLVTHVVATVLSSKNLIPLNLSDDITYGILKRIVQLLTNNIVHLNDNTLKQIIDNVFTLSTETKRLQLQFQQILTLLQSQKLSANEQFGVGLWFKVANHIEENLTAANIDALKEVIYGYVEWAVKSSNICQVS